MSKLIDLTGQKFGRLIVVRRMANDKSRHSKWLCKCNCKNEIIVYDYNLKSGNTKSCGDIIYSRFYNCGWTLKEALTIPVGTRRKNV